MKKSTIIFLFLMLSLGMQAQKNKNTNMNKKLQEIEDRIALKNLVDTFSVLADIKDVEKQLLLFTEDAVVESVSDGQAGAALKGRKQIGDAFSGFLNNFSTVYHINGQQTLRFNSETSASGVSYCLVFLVADAQGKKMKTTLAVHYNDEYVKQNGRWYIAKRKSHFDIRETNEIK